MTCNAASLIQECVTCDDEDLRGLLEFVLFSVTGPVKKRPNGSQPFQGRYYTLGLTCYQNSETKKYTSYLKTQYGSPEFNKN